MNRRARSAVSIAVIGLWLVVAPTTKAVIDCMPDVLDGSVMDSTVRGIVPEADNYDLILVRTVTGIQNVVPEQPSMPTTAVDIAVELVFKGNPPGELQLPASQPLPTGVTFVVGERYFIVAGEHAFNAGEPMQVWPCGPTRQVSDDEVRRLIGAAPSARALADTFGTGGLAASEAGSISPILITAIAVLLIGATSVILRRRT